MAPYAGVKWNGECILQIWFYLLAKSTPIELCVEKKVYWCVDLCNEYMRLAIQFVSQYTLQNFKNSILFVDCHFEPIEKYESLYDWLKCTIGDGFYRV